MQKGRSSLILFGLALVAGLVFAGLYQKFFRFDASPWKRSYAACLGGTQVSNFRLKPSFYLNKKLISGGSELSTEAQRAFVESHIRHLYTILPTFSRETTPKYSVVPYDGSLISDIQVVEAKYPLSLQIDATTIHQKFLTNLHRNTDLDASYIREALKVGEVHQGDEALRIDYTVDLQVLSCEDEGKLTEQIFLPVDPLLGYWFVPSDKRILRYDMSLGQDRAITPCSTPEYVFDQDPYYYWFYWSLNPDHCESSLIPGSVVEYKAEGLVKSDTRTDHPLSLSFIEQIPHRPLRMTVAMTLIEDDSVLVRERFDLHLKERIQLIMQENDFINAKKGLQALTAYDVAAQTGVIFAWSLKKLSSDFKFEQVELGDQLLRWKIAGQFRQSGKSYEVDLVIGSAIKGAGSFDSFYRTLNRGLAESDIVYFRGHSGAGTNLEKNRIDQQVVQIQGAGAASVALKHQLVVLMSCYSLRYFAPQVFPLPEHDFTRDILYTASVPADYDSRMLVGLMEQIESQLSEGEHLPMEAWPQSFSRDVLLVHKSVNNKKDWH